MKVNYIFDKETNCFTWELVSKEDKVFALTEFLTQKTNILLGTQSELVKLKNREDSGKLDGLIVEAVKGFTDLLQFMLISKSSGVSEQR